MKPYDITRVIMTPPVPLKEKSGPTNVCVSSPNKNLLISFRNLKVTILLAAV